MYRTLSQDQPRSVPCQPPAKRVALTGWVWLVQWRQRRDGDVCYDSHRPFAVFAQPAKPSLSRSKVGSRRCEAAVVHLLRRLIVQRLVRPNGVVLLDVGPDRFPELTGRAVLVEVDLLGLQATEPSLDHDVVRPAGLAVHALGDLELLQQRLILPAGKLRTLVRIQNGG